MTLIMQQILDDLTRHQDYMLTGSMGRKRLKIFIQQSCIRYAQGIVPEKKESHTADLEATGFNICRREIISHLQEDTLPTS